MLARHITNLRTLSSLTLLLLGAAHASGQECEEWLPGGFHAQTNGNNGDIYTSTVWTPPGGVPLLVVAGNFDTIGGVTVNNIAAWDGASWRALGMGTNGSVLALTAYNGELIAGGYFEQADGQQMSHIARFNGTQWLPMGTGLTLSSFNDAHCRALTVHDGEVIATGNFWSAGGVSTRNIARWNGTNWAPLGFPGTGLSHLSPADEPTGWALASYNGSLYVGGNFAQADGLTANHIARWNGTNWSTLGTGLNSPASCMTVHNGELAVAGGFSTAGGVTANNVARWNGFAWSNIPNSPFGFHFSIVSYAGHLVLGTSGFNDVISAWNGSSWGSLDGGIPGPWVFALTVYNNNLIAAGRFSSAGSPSITAKSVAQWNGVSWSPLQARPATVTAYENLNGRLIIGGSFVQSTTNSVPANNIMAWDGARKTQFNGGVNAVSGFEGAVDSVRALKAYSDPGPFGASHLVVGGYFTNAGGISVNRIAMWNEPAFTVPNWSAMGNGFNAGVFAIERHNGVIYAAGEFTMSGGTPVNYIAQWNGSAWIPVGGGMNSHVYALKSFNGQLYAGGFFTTAGGVNTGGLARWNGTSWSAVNNFAFNGTVYALELHDFYMLIGGVIPNPGVSQNVLGYNGQGYFTIGNFGTNGPVYSLKSAGDNVYVGGDFTTAGGTSASRLARWNEPEGWSAVSGGTDAVVLALGKFQNEVQVGGVFNTVENATIPARAWARYVENETPWIVQQPFSQTGHCFDNIGFTVEAPAGYTVSAQWRKNGQGIVSGVTPWGSVISGTNSTHLVIDHLHPFDAGDYTCQLNNECGDVESTVATLDVVDCCLEDIAPNGGDGLVNIDDLVALITSWGACPVAATCRADISPFGGNSTVNIDDLVMVITAWGACP